MHYFFFLNERLTFFFILVWQYVHEYHFFSFTEKLFPWISMVDFLLDACIEYFCLSLKPKHVPLPDFKQQIGKISQFVFLRCKFSHIGVHVGNTQVHPRTKLIKILSNCRLAVEYFFSWVVKHKCIWPETLD